MTPHQWLPLFAFALNVCLAAVSLVRHPGSRVNRLFAYFLSALALWNFGVLMLRRAPDPVEAVFWEVVIHAGVIALPAFHYHFVMTVLETTVRRRRWLVSAYVMTAVFSVLNLTGSSLFMRGVRQTTWGWVPVSGPLYHVFLVIFYGFFIAGLMHLRRAYRTTDSGFRRNRLQLIALGTAITISGGFIDIIRFALASVVPTLEHIYPVGIPANVLCAVFLAVAIVRYRMFDVSLAMKKVAVYAAVSAVATTVLMGVTWTIEESFALRDASALWIIAPLGFVVSLLLTPFGRPVAEAVERLTFSRRRGCHDALVDLSKRLGTLLALDRVVDTLVEGLAHGVPLVHCALLLRDEDRAAFVLRRAIGESTAVRPIPADGPIARWLQSSDGVVVKEEALLRRRFDELDEIDAALIVPLTIEGRVIGVLLVGEKLSGALFDAEELALLGVVASQAAIAMHNARLYEEAERQQRRNAALYELARRLAGVHDPDAILTLVVQEAARLLDAAMVGLRLLEGEELVLACSSDTTVSSIQRPRLRVGESLSGLVVAINEPVNVEDVTEDRRYDTDHKRVAEVVGIHAFLGVPIRSENGGAIGVVYAYAKQRRRFRPDEISLLGALADQAAVTVERSRLAAERHRAEEALRQSEKLATMGELLAGVAHELNNPLTVILGFAGFLGARLAGGPLEEPSRHIENAAIRCGRIVRNFLALARKHPPERRRVDLNQIVTDAVELVAYPLGVDGVESRVDLAADLPNLWADPHQLQQVIVNLLTNAHHALRQSKTRRLRLATHHDAARGRVVLNVADSGPGVPPAVRARIFDPFFTTKPMGEGTGLGLSLCLGIVENHGGTITVGDGPDAGALFIVELPVESPIATEAEPPAPTATESQGGRHILIVDDEAAVASLLRQTLVAVGHRVEIAGSAFAALDLLAARRYDLVISDIKMPGLDGPRLYRAVEQRQPATHPPFIFITGDMLGADTRQFVQLTNATCLAKPFTIDDVQHAIRQVFDSALAV